MRTYKNSDFVSLLFTRVGKIAQGAVLTLIVISCIVPYSAHAQNEAVPDVTNIDKAQVLEMTNQHTTTVPGTDTPSEVQTLKAKVLDGPEKGQIVTFDNDFTQLSDNDVFYIRHQTSQLEGVDFWSVSDPYRLNVLLGLASVFVLVLVIFGGLQGVRGLLSFGGSLALIFYLLIPGILNGYSPIVLCIGVASLIIIVGSYITHGFNRTTTAAVLGMIATVVITGIGAFWVVHAGHLSGFTNEDNVYLNFNSRGKIDMVGLLFGGIMIGILGVLYDIAISQAIAVEELLSAGTHLSRVDIYNKAIRMGREHIGALVNTLAIAYVGVALPLLLLVQQTSTMSLMSILNGEMFATEAIRILIGSIGLVLGVPITTMIASYMLRDRPEGTPAKPSHAHHH